MAAAGKGRLQEVTLLLAAGAKTKVLSKGGTARDWALRFGHTEVAEMLQQHEEAAQAADTAVDDAIALSTYQVGCALSHSTRAVSLFSCYVTISGWMGGVLCSCMGKIAAFCM